MDQDFEDFAFEINDEEVADMVRVVRGQREQLANRERTLRSLGIEVGEAGDDWTWRRSDAFVEAAALRARSLELLDAPATGWVWCPTF